MARLAFEIQRVQDVLEKDRLAMFEIFRQYYDLPEPDSFFRDFAVKDDVIILRVKGSGEIKGFSTQMKLRHQIDGREYLGVFSGDTILDREFWGDQTLTKAFLWYLLKLWWSHKSPVYWHLVSKGYKTYLLMINNCENSYPRFDRATPPLYQRLSEDFAHQLYPQTYRKDLGLLVFEGPHEHLKTNVAPITEELMARHPHIRYFAKRNPEWAKGNELVCVAQFHPFLIFSFVKKLISKALRRFPLFKRSPAS